MRPRRQRSRQRTSVTCVVPVQRSNVLLYGADWQRFDTLGPLGNPDVHAPNLDRLGASRLNRETLFPFAARRLPAFVLAR